jgi:predicted ATPase/DNA-binding SARP family transcriptional activator
VRVVTPRDRRGVLVRRRGDVVGGLGERAGDRCQGAERDQRRDDRMPVVTGTDRDGRPVSGRGALQVGRVGFSDRACDVVVVHGCPWAWVVVVVGGQRREACQRATNGAPTGRCQVGVESRQTRRGTRLASMDSAGGFRVEVLGPVEAWVDTRRVALGGQRPRALLAVLALMGGRVVSSERLIDELWGEDPPARARDSLQMHVSRLRKALTEAGGDADRLVSQAGGYVLQLGPGARDVDRWEAALERARQARAAGQLEDARMGIEEALGVWRGAPLGGTSAHGLLDGERARLDEERLAATIEGIELDLVLGRHGELLGQLEALVIAHPFKERLVAHQMLALYRCGRQADALAAFQTARARFVEELGIEPSPALRELHEDVLKHSAELSTPVEVRAGTSVDAQPRPAMPSVLGKPGLPVPPNRTIGREHELSAVGERLRAGSVRLLTLTGAGGVGKTRLALEAARAVQSDFADGARFVSLAALRRPDDVPAAIVQALGIIVLSGESPEQSVERFLATKHLLLVIDNLEHLLAAAPFIGRLVGACPALTVLATSRELLALQAEAHHPVLPLALPEHRAHDDPEALADVDAVTLFCDRARAHDPDFRLSAANAAAVAEICRHLDGLPLAIELAAARCGLLSPDEIADRLDQAIGAGARDAPARQQTLRATIDWSHDLLGDGEKACFARFAVFAGGATVDATESVTQASLDTLDHLVAKSLLIRRQHADSATRLGMLETIRGYAIERFASAEDAEAVRADHYSYYLALAQRDGDERALWGAGGKEHLARLDADIDNLHSALGWAVGQASAERALAMAAALSCYWSMRNRYADAVGWIDQALNLPGADAHPALRVRTLVTKATGLFHRGRTDELAPVLAEAEAIARQLGDPAILSRTLSACAVRQAMTTGPPNAVDALADEALDCAVVAGDDWAAAMAALARVMGEPTPAELRERVDRAASLLDEAGNVYRLASLYGSAAYNALKVGSDGDAKEFLDSALQIARELDHPFTWLVVHGNLGVAALLTGDTDAAREGFRQELKLCRDLVARPFVFEGLRGLAAVAAVDGDLHRAARLAGAAAMHLYGQPQDAVDDRLDAAFFEASRARCGARAWDAAARDGSTLSFEDAIAYALDEPPAQMRAHRQAAT